MQNVISAIVTFLLSAMIAGVFYFHHKKGEPIYFTEPSSVPVIVLFFGLPVMILVLWLYSLFLQETPAEKFLAPRFFEIKIPSERLAYLWEKISVFVMIVLPLIGFLHFWDRFDKGTAWPLAVGPLCAVPADTVLEEVDLYAPTDPLWYGFRAQYRYGSRDMPSVGSAARTDCEVPNGVDYYPFWQPLIMGAFGGIVLIMAARNLLLVYRRRPVRCEAVAEAIRAQQKGAAPEK